MSSKSFFSFIGLSVLFSLSANALAQNEVRPRIVAQPTPQQQKTVPEVKIIPQQTNVTKPTPQPITPIKVVPQQTNTTVTKPNITPNTPTPQIKPSINVTPTTATSAKQLSAFIQLRSHMKDAQRMLTSNVMPTAFTSPATAPLTDFVTLAALDHSTSKIHLLNLNKKDFLMRDNEMNVMTTQGKSVTLRIVRANGVNTAVSITDENQKHFTPLLVQYPVEREGKYYETAYYISVHPMLRSHEAVSAGKLYLKTTFDLALKRIRDKGKIISPVVVGIAERLCVVEHIDHMRYKTESRAELYDEVYALLAFNEGNTYRYAVSTAGAGGLIQMIPATYRMVRQAYPTMGLEPDFVVGMRNHTNAVQAMLLYMQDTWDDLSSNEEVLYALENNIATQAELLSAGYNSNPARLPRYLERGGDGWRTIIPRETQMYLDIYKTFETVMPSKPLVTQKAETAGTGQTKVLN